MLQHRPGAFVAVLLVVLVACSSTSSRSVDSAVSSIADVSSTSVVEQSTAVGDSTTSTSVVTAPTTTPVTPAPTTQPTTAPTTAATTTLPVGPTITSFSMSDPAVCAAPDVSFVTTPPVVTITWTATGADSVYVAIDNRDGPYVQDLPLVGSVALNFSCPGPHTYWVVAVKGGVKDYKSKSFN